MSYQQRECPECLGRGTVVEDAHYDHEYGKLVQEVVVCPLCKGVGSISVFLYASPRRQS